MVTQKSHTLYPIFKQVFDVVAAFLLLLVTAPIFLATAIAIKLDSKGPIIFKQGRVGQGTKEFTAYKFRSMYTGSPEDIHKQYIHQLIKGERGQAAQAGGVYKLVADPRITRVGKWIRKMSIDELPQLWNVLRGDMSLVGPRPALAYELEHYEEWMRERFSVKPGITGWWQVGGRSSTDYRDMVEKDVYYVRNLSWRLDFLILCKTPMTIFQISKAY